MKQWLVKRDQAVEGPLTSKEIIDRIHSGDLVGTEKISLHPDGRWKNLAQVPEFYEEILRVMEASGVRTADDKTEALADTSPESLGVTDESELPTEFLKHHPEKGPSKGKLETVTSGEEPTKTYHRPIKKSQVGAPVVLELEESSRAKKKIRRRAMGRPAVALIAVLLLLIGYFILVPTNTKYKSLLRPAEKSVERIDQAEAHKMLVNAFKHFVLDTYSGYLASQNLLVRLIEGGRESNGAYELLCATYRELWPHVRQDHEDLKTIREVVLRARKFNPVASAAQTCDLSERLLSGQFSRAESLSHKLLQSHPEYIFLNEMTGELQVARRDYRAAMFHYNQAKLLWEPKPVWAKILVREAQIRIELATTEPQQWNKARELLDEVLTLSPQHALGLILRGRVELEGGGGQERALNYLRAALSSPELALPADQGEANYVMALILNSMGEKSEAKAAASRAYKLYPHREGLEDFLKSLGGAPKVSDRTASRELVFLGDQYMRAGNCLAAQKEYRAAFEKDPKNGLGAMKAAQCLWTLHQADEAIDYLQRALRADPDLINAYVLLADYHGERFNQKAAFQVLQSAFRRDPKNYMVLKGFAAFELKRRNFKAAEQHARRALDLYGTDTETLLILVDALLQMGNFEEALKLASQALELESVNPSAHIAYAKALRELQGGRRAIDYVRSQITDLPRSYELRRALAEFLFLETRYSDAKEMVRQALALEPKDKQSYLLLAEIQKREKQLNGAREALLSAAALDPTDAEPLFLLGHLSLENGNLNAAVSQFEAVLRINPNYPLVQYALGRVELKLGNPERALERANLEKKVHPGLADPYVLAAEASFLLKDYSQCVQEYQQAIDRSRPDALLYVRLARCFRLSGSTDAAMTMLDQAVYIESGNPEVYKEQGAIFEMMGNNEEARVAYEKYLQLAPGASDREQIRAVLRGL
jgi:tetratricopeptide (TPR) repeat protein